jgi:hypothetical protein
LIERAANRVHLGDAVEHLPQGRTAAAAPHGFGQVNQIRHLVEISRLSAKEA